MKPLALLLAALLAAPALANDVKLGAIEIEHPWARATLPGQPVGGAYLTLRNRGAADRLVAVSSTAAEATELHRMSHEGEVMRMRQVTAIELPAGKTVEFKPGALHLMLTGLKAPLRAGTRFPLTLRFERAGEVTVEVTVEEGAAAAAGHDMKHMKH